MSIRDLNRLDTLPEEEEEDYYYDMHPTKEDLMGESVAQQDLMSHLISLLKELYHIEGWFVSGNLNIYRTADKKEYPLAPDVALFKGVVLSRATRVPLRSWKMVLPERPAPTVVFEICSKETWKDDLKKKPEKYRQMGVKEYYAYDPNMPQYWSDRPNRLRGWHYQAGELIELKLDERGWLWSNELDSWLVPDGEFLQLYDRAGRRRLTLTEAERAAKEAALMSGAAERAAKEAALMSGAAERAAKEKAWAKLRELNIDPEKL